MAEPAHSAAVSLTEKLDFPAVRRVVAGAGTVLSVLPTSGSGRALRARPRRQRSRAGRGEPRSPHAVSLRRAPAAAKVSPSSSAATP